MDEELRVIMEKRIKQFNLTQEQEIVLALYCKVFYQEGYKDALKLIDAFFVKDKE